LLLGCGERGALKVSPDAAGTGDTGRARATLVFFDAPHYSFGSATVGSLRGHTFTLTNTGSAKATMLMARTLISPFAFGGNGAYPGDGGTCGVTLDAGASCTIVVVFIASGSSATATLSIAYDASVEPSVVEIGLDGSTFIPL
jgi:hypothetical protein